jgi:hypothetical protein
MPRRRSSGAAADLNWRQNPLRRYLDGVMESKPTPQGPDVDRLIVPDELLQQLQNANERFRTAKENLEHATGDSEYDHGQHVEDRLSDLQKIEREIEEISKNIQEILGRRP